MLRSARTTRFFARTRIVFLINVTTRIERDNSNVRNQQLVSRIAPMEVREDLIHARPKVGLMVFPGGREPRMGKSAYRDWASNLRPFFLA